MTDSAVTLSLAKAKELHVKDGDSILVIGRRRRATYARVTIAKEKKDHCSVSENIASNLRLRNGDKLKAVPLGASLDETHSGDMILLSHKTPPKISSVTFSPVEDSKQNLEAREGGDEISDDQIMERFIKPYLHHDSAVLMKKGHLLALVDENGRKLEVMVTHLEIEGEETKEGSEGMPMIFKVCFCQWHVFHTLEFFSLQ